MVVRLHSSQLEQTGMPLRMPGIEDKRMRSPILVPVIAALMLSLTACEIDLGDSARHSKDFHHNYPLAANGRLSVETFNGGVEISTWDRDEVDISGTKYGPSLDAMESLDVNIDHSPASVSVRAVRPSTTRGGYGVRFVIKVPRSAVLDRITSSNGAIRTVGGSGPSRFRTSNGQVRVEDLHGRLDASTSNGAIEMIGIGGDATAHTSNGRVRGEGIQGAVDVETSNGSVDVGVDAVPQGGVRVNTSNGSITMRLPRDGSARIAARTSNSSIDSEHDLRMRGPVSKNRLEGELGSGGPLVDLATSNGGIHLR
jgi:DUF4097 and DUF4098 domain-containing protein YvlB